MKKNNIIKEHFGYGVIPSFVIIYIYYIYFAFINTKVQHLDSSVIISFFYFVIILIILRFYKSNSIINYIGFKLIPLYKRILYFLFYYIGFFGLTSIFNSDFNHFVNQFTFYFFPIIVILFLSILPIIRVPRIFFTRISPRIYQDSITFHYHTLEDLHTYNVVSILDNSLTIYKCTLMEEFHNNTRHLIEDENMNFSFFSDKIAKCNFEVIDETNKSVVVSAELSNGEIIWKENFYFTHDEKYNKEKLENLFKSIIFLENL